MLVVGWLQVLQVVLASCAQFACGEAVACGGSIERRVRVVEHFADSLFCPSELDSNGAMGVPQQVDLVNNESTRHLHVLMLVFAENNVPSKWCVLIVHIAALYTEVDDSV